MRTYCTRTEAARFLHKPRHNLKSFFSWNEGQLPTRCKVQGTYICTRWWKDDSFAQTDGREAQHCSCPVPVMFKMMRVPSSLGLVLWPVSLWVSSSSQFSFRKIVPPRTQPTTPSAHLVTTDKALGPRARTFTILFFSSFSQLYLVCGRGRR